MEALGGGAISYERGTLVAGASQRAEISNTNRESRETGSRSSQRARATHARNTEGLRPRSHVPKRACAYVQRKLNEHLSGNEVYYTACSLLAICNDSCSKLHDQRGLNLTLFLYKGATSAEGVLVKKVDGAERAR